MVFNKYVYTYCIYIQNNCQEAILEMHVDILGITGGVAVIVFDVGFDFQAGAVLAYIGRVRGAY
jgi:hypothetical protein